MTCDIRDRNLPCKAAAYQLVVYTGTTGGRTCDRDGDEMFGTWLGQRIFRPPWCTPPPFMEIYGWAGKLGWAQACTVGAVNSGAQTTAR